VRVAVASPLPQLFRQQPPPQGLNPDLQPLGRQLLTRKCRTEVAITSAIDLQHAAAKIHRVPTIRWSATQAMD